MAQSTKSKDGIDHITPKVAAPPSRYPMNNLRLSSVCIINFNTALSDTAPLALMPFLEKHYSVTPTVLSLLFVSSALGFIIAALFVDGITSHLDRARTYVLSHFLLIALCQIPLVFAAPLSIVILSFFAAGFVASFHLTIGNVFCASSSNGRHIPTSTLGAMHAAYGLGAALSPLFATFIARHTIWTRYYAMMAALTLCAAGFAGYAFRGYEKDTKAVGSEKEASVGAGGKDRASPEMHGMFTAVSTRVVVMGALFIFAYRAAEVSISSRANGGVARGFVFWMGITVGRSLMVASTRALDERRFVYGLVSLAAAFEVLVWLVPGLISNGTASAMVGLLLGPVYPCAVAVFMRSMAGHEQVSGIGVISAFGSSGGAAAPFTAGILAEVLGPVVLHPIAIGLFGVMVSCWCGLPRKPKRRE